MSTSPKKRKLSNEESQDAIIVISEDNSPKRSKTEEITSAQENVLIPSILPDNSLIANQENLIPSILPDNSLIINQENVIQNILPDNSLIINQEKVIQNILPDNSSIANQENVIQNIILDNFLAVDQENVIQNILSNNFLTADQNNPNNNLNINQNLSFDDKVKLDIASQFDSQQLNLQQTASQQLNIQQTAPQQLNLQQTDSQQLNIQQTASQQLNIQQTAPQQLNLQQTDSQQLNIQQTDSQQLNLQQTDSQQLNLQKAESEKLNLELVNLGSQLEALDSQKFAQQEDDPKIKLEQLLSQVESIKKALNGSKKGINSEYQLKDYLQPNKKKDLFTADEISNKQRIGQNFVILVEESMDVDNEKMTDLFDEDEINIIDDLIEKDEDLIEIFLLLFFKKNKWSFIESINLTNKKFTSEQLLKKLEILENDGYLLGSNGIESLEQGMYLLEHSQISEVVRSCFNVEKSKTKNISSMLNFVKKNKTALSGKSLEESKLSQIKKQLKRKVFKVNPEVSKIFYKLLVTQFEPIQFNNNIYNYFSNLVANLQDPSVAEKYPIIRDDKNLIIENNQIDPIYKTPNDLNKFTEACFIELNLREKNYDKLKDMAMEIILKLEECLKENYLQDIKLDEWLFKFTCVGRMLDVLKYLNNILDENLNKLIGKELKELIELLNDCDDSLEEEKEEIFKFKDIQYDTIDLDLSEEYSDKKESDKKKKSDKAIDGIEEELAIQHLKDKFNIDNVVKNANNLFEAYLFELFYDVIYDSNIKNTFIYRFQKYPLDINSKLFYKNRKSNFEIKIKEYNENKSQFLIDKLKKTRTDFKCIKNVTKSGKFSLDKMRDLYLLIQKKKLMNIIVYLVKDYNKRKDSSCDLILYDVDDDFKFIEFIHDDRELDEEKINWIKFLKKLNFEVEIYNIINENRLFC